jgi:hypothetical protein
MREATERRRVAEQASANQQTVIEMLLRYAVAPDKQAALEAAGIHRVGEMSKTELSDFLVKMGQALAR